MLLLYGFASQKSMRTLLLNLDLPLNCTVVPIGNCVCRGLRHSTTSSISKINVCMPITNTMSYDTGRG